MVHIFVVTSMTISMAALEEQGSEFMGRCIDRLMDKVLTFLTVSNHKCVIPAPILSPSLWRRCILKCLKVFTKIKIKKNWSDGNRRSRGQAKRKHFHSQKCLSMLSLNGSAKCFHKDFKTQV